MPSPKSRPSNARHYSSIFCRITLLQLCSKPDHVSGLCPDTVENVIRLKATKPTSIYLIVLFNYFNHITMSPSRKICLYFGIFVTFLSVRIYALSILSCLLESVPSPRQGSQQDFYLPCLYLSITQNIRDRVLCLKSHRS